MKLTGEQIEEFRTNGVLIVKNVLYESELDPVIDELGAWVDKRACELHGAGKIEKLYPDAPFETRFGFLYKQCKSVEPMDLVCCKGDVVLLNKFTPHRSVPNVSDKCRWSLDLRYQTTGHHTGRTTYPAFIVRSPSNPASVLRDYDEWCRLWIDALENRRGVTMHRTD